MKIPWQTIAQALGGFLIVVLLAIAGVFWNRLEKLDSGQTQTNVRVAVVEKQFVPIDARLTAIENRLERLEDRLFRLFAQPLSPRAQAEAELQRDFSGVVFTTQSLQVNGNQWGVLIDVLSKQNNEQTSILVLIRNREDNKLVRSLVQASIAEPSAMPLNAVSYQSRPLPNKIEFPPELDSASSFVLRGSVSDVIEQLNNMLVKRKADFLSIVDVSSSTSKWERPITSLTELPAEFARVLAEFRQGKRHGGTRGPG